MRGGRKPDFKLNRTQIKRLEQAREEARIEKDVDWDNRLRAILLVGRDGKTRKEAAEVCEVSERTLYDWQNRFVDGGVAALRRGYSAGRPSRLTAQEREELANLVREGPEAAGLDTGTWNCATIASVVQERFGVSYSASQIRRILKQLKFSYQVPQTRLSKADEEKRRVWQETTFPGLIERTRTENCVIFF